jgi:hypothetical protein
MKTEYYTYAHVRNDTNKIFYIGKGCRQRAFSKAGHNRWWNRIVEKHGYTADILAYWSTEAEAFEHEKFLIECFRKMGYELVNRTDGGEGSSGRIVTEETRKKISLANKGQISPNKGKKASAELRAKMSAAHKGLPIHNGWTLTEETRKKMSEAKLGKPAPNKGKTFPPKSQELRDKIREGMKATWARKKLLKGS